MDFDFSLPLATVARYQDQSFMAKERFVDSLQALALLKAAKEGRTVAYPPLDFDINDMAGFFD